MSEYKNYKQYNSASTNNVIENFLDVLRIEGKSEVSIKNYKSDIKNFLKWRSQHLSEIPLRQSLIEYSIHIENKYKKGTIKRKVSTINSFISFINPLTESSVSENKVGIFEKIERFVNFAPLAMSILLLVLLLPLAKAAFTDYSPNSRFVPENLKVSTVNPNEINLPNGERIALVVSAPEVDQDKSPDPVMINKVLSYKTESEIIEENYGKGIIKSGDDSYTIYSDEISKESLIFITPTSNTYSSTIYVSNIGEGFAVISSNQEVVNDISFNWLIKNESNISIL